jgi:hypothetical protein
MKSGSVEQLDPAGAKTIGSAIGAVREVVYLPKLDLLLYNGFIGDERQIAYDPAKNRWVTLKLSRAGCKNKQLLGGVGAGYVYDSRRDLVWAIGEYNENFVLKIDPATLDASEEAK